MIERVYAHNFRCLQNFTIELSNSPSVLVIGKNGSGKSTFRHCLEIFQQICRGKSRARELVSTLDFAHDSLDVPIRFKIELTLLKRRFRYTIAFEMPAGFREARIAEEALEVDGEHVFLRQQSQVTVGAGSTFRIDWHVVALPIINERVGDQAIHEIREYFGAMVLISPIPDLMSGYSEDDSTELVSNASNFSSWLAALLSRHPASYGTLDTNLKRLMPDFESLENIPKGESGKQLVVRFQDPQEERTIPIDFGRLSSGEKCLLLSAVLIAFNKSSGPVFCMWDEPDNHLSLQEIDHFTTQLRKMTNHRGQLVVTSHHPSTIRCFSDDSTIVFTRSSHLEPTSVQLLSNMTYKGDLVEALSRGEILE